MPLRPRGLEAPGAGFEPASHGVTVARRTDSTIPERRRRQQDSNLRTGVNRLRASNALPCRLGHASRGGRRGESNPQGHEDPPVFETGYRASGSPSSDPGRNRTRTSPGKSRELSIELRSQCGRQESNLHRPAFQAGALPVGATTTRWARLESNQRPLVCKTKRSQPAELLARDWWAGLESNQRPLPYQRSARH